MVRRNEEGATEKSKLKKCTLIKSGDHEVSGIWNGRSNAQSECEISKKTEVNITERKGQRKLCVRQDVRK